MNTVSDISCDLQATWLSGPRTSFRHCVLNRVERCNHDLGPKVIWIEALTSCSYNAENLVSTSQHIRVLSDSASDGMIDEEERPSLDDCDSSVVEGHDESWDLGNNQASNNGNPPRDNENF